MVKGFKAWGVSSGIKKDGGPDLALIVSECDAIASGVFTRNRVKAAPVILSMEHIKNETIRAIIANSGNANACTGREGLDDARNVCRMISEYLNIKSSEVIVASTGVIGERLNTEAISKAIPELVKGLSPDGFEQAARAIMTTDTFPKISSFTGDLDGINYNILGIAKGAGMIMPDMATMLCFIVTDIKLDRERLNQALFEAVNCTFNRISVDGDTSTNDMVVMLANGAAGNKGLTESQLKGFKIGLIKVMEDLSAMIVKDGEGATKVIKVMVKGAVSGDDALKAVREVSNSLLVKTAFYGGDPNWGRIMAVLGRCSIEFVPDKVDIWIDHIKIVSGGIGNGRTNEIEASKQMSSREFSLTIDLNMGDCEEHMLTCDLTHGYVDINASYRT